MPPGGSRPGEQRGGRKKGTPNKATVERRKLIAGLKASSLSPIEVFSDILRDVTAPFALRFCGGANGSLSRGRRGYHRITECTHVSVLDAVPDGRGKLITLAGPPNQLTTERFSRCCVVRAAGQ
jgi:hypothetical protein